ncbi:MAG: MFS transporter [Reichenbachiella sp.]
MLNKQKFSNWPFHPKKWPFFYGWMIIISGTLGIIMSIPGQTMGVSTFTDSLIGALKMSRDDLTTSYLAGTIVSASLLTWVGKLYDKKGVRPIAMLSTVSMALVLVYLSQTDRIIYWLAETNDNRLLNIVMMFLGFFMLRFAGQGALTMVSRNMMMKWFEKRRGFAMGFSNVATAICFSMAPVFFEFLIKQNGWRGAWIVLAAIAGLGFTFYILVFFRDDPENSDIAMDGNYVPTKNEKTNLFPVVKDYTLVEARGTFSFWLFTAMLAAQALYITGLTFNITSLFEVSGLSREEAVQIFIPSAVIAVIVTLSVSKLSDYIRLKYLLYVMGCGGMIALIGMIFLGDISWALYLLIFGNGILMGLYSVVLSVTWPRYFGKTHLGAISGHSIMYIVVASAIGPKLFSEALSYHGSYDAAGWACLIMYAIFTIAAVWANNPQEKWRKSDK